MQRFDEVKDKLSTSTVVYLNGIDRLDSSIGYIFSNCVPCCTHCNLAKRMLSVDEFLAWAKRLYEFSFLKMPPTMAVKLPYKSKWH